MQVSNIFRDFSFQAASFYLATVLQAIRGILLAIILGPTDLGTLSLIALILSYGQYSDLGMVFAVSREIPIYSGAGRTKEVSAWESYGYFGKIIGGLLVAAGIVVYVLLNSQTLQSEIKYGLLSAAVVVLLQGITVAQQAILQAKRLFSRAAILTLTISIGSLIAGLLGALLNGVKGVFLSQVIVLIATSGVGIILCGFPRAIVPKIERMRELLRLGIPLSLLSFVAYNMINIDQLIILRFLNRQALGVYTIVLYMGSLIYILPTAVAAVIGPRLLNKRGETAELDSLHQLTWMPVYYLSLTLPILIVLVWIFAPLFIVNLLPNFSRAIGPLRVYSVGVFFLGVNLGTSTFLIALKKHIYNIPIISFVIFLNIVLDIIFVRMLNLGLVGIALGSTFTYLIYWLLHSCLARWYFDKNLVRNFVFNLGNGWPGFLLGAFVFLLWKTGGLFISNPIREFQLLSVVTAVAFIRWLVGEKNYTMKAVEKNA